MPHRMTGLSRDQLAEFCRRWKISELASPSTHESEDVGLYVTFQPQAEWTLVDRITMQKELSSLAGFDVNLHSRRSQNFHPLAHRAARNRHMTVLYDA
jgi:predicted nucleotidyltransferase